jgi:mannose-1-phosphate guanylyltransferase
MLMFERTPEAIPAVFFAGGSAGALRPVSDFFPKCMLPLGEKTLMQRILETFDTDASQNFIIIVGRLGEMVINHVETMHRAGIFQREVSFLHMDESLSNTGGFLKQCAADLPERFFVCYADVWIPELRPGAVLKQHLAMRKAHRRLVATLVCSMEHRMGVGVVSPAGTSKLVASFVEKPQSYGAPINTATCVLEKQILDYVDDPRDGLFPAVIPKAIAAGETVSYSLCDEWIHIQTLADLYAYNVETRNR